MSYILVSHSSLQSLQTKGRTDDTHDNSSAVTKVRWAKNEKNTNVFSMFHMWTLRSYTRINWPT